MRSEALVEPWRTATSSPTGYASGMPVVDYEITGKTAKFPGEEYAWLSSWYPLHSMDGVRVGVGALVQEITERNLAESKWIPGQARSYNPV